MILAVYLAVDNMKDPLLGRRLLRVAMCERLAGDSADSIM